MRFLAVGAKACFAFHGATGGECARKPRRFALAWRSVWASQPLRKSGKLPTGRSCNGRTACKSGWRSRLLVSISAFDWGRGKCPPLDCHIFADVAEDRIQIEEDGVESIA